MVAQGQVNTYLEFVQSTGDRQTGIYGNPIMPIDGGRACWKHIENSLGGVIIVHLEMSEGTAHPTTVGKVYRTIAENPGICYSNIMEMAHIGNGTASYHLHKLEKKRAVVSRACGKYKRFWTSDFRELKKRKALPDMCIKTIDLLHRNNGGLTVGKIAAMLGITPSGLCYHLRILEANNLLERKKEGRQTMCHLLPEPGDKRLLKDFSITF